MKRMYHYEHGPRDVDESELPYLAPGWNENPVIAARYPQAPTFEEYVAAGYLPENYPPEGYPSKPSDGLTEYRRAQAEVLSEELTKLSQISAEQTERLNEAFAEPVTEPVVNIETPNPAKVEETVVEVVKKKSAKG